MHFNNDSNFTMRVNKHLCIFPKDVDFIWKLWDLIPVYKEML